MPDTLSGQTLRIIDANLNRAGEGLRLLEDIARLFFNDAELTKQLKNIRHELLECDLPFNFNLIQARDAAGDVGINMKAARQEEHKELPLVVVANSRRVQESLRVLEEIAKSVPNLDTDKYRQVRFELYDIERTLVSKLSRKDKVKRLAGLQVTLDAGGLSKKACIEIAAKAIAVGTSAIYLLDRVSPKRALLQIALELRKLCSEYHVLFIVDRHLDIAMAANADGLLLEQDSLPVEVMRKLMPIDKLLGCFVKTEEQAGIAQSEGADYVSFYIASPTGIKRLRQIKAAVSLPVVAVGAINVDNVREIVSASTDAIAIKSADKTNFEKEARLIAKLYKQQ